MPPMRRSFDKKAFLRYLDGALNHVLAHPAFPGLATPLPGDEL